MTTEVLDSFPEPVGSECVARITGTRGGSTFEVIQLSLCASFTHVLLSAHQPDSVRICPADRTKWTCCLYVPSQLETADGIISTCQLPSKFKNVIWIKRGTRSPTPFSKLPHAFERTYVFPHCSRVVPR